MNSGKTIRWAILGTSFISEVMAKAIQASASSQLVAIGSRSLSSARQFATSFSILKVYDDYQLLLNDQEIDAIYIGLPNHLHKEWIIRCAQAGKHILCEKPLVLNADEAREVISIINEKKVFCMEALMYRCHPFTIKLQEIIQSRILGDIKLYNAMYAANIADLANPTAGGSIRNLGCYPISLIRLLADDEPVEVIASGRLNPKNQTDNQASAILKFRDHSMAVVSTADDMEMCWQFDIYGSEGSLKVITNPWLPETEDNLCIIHRFDEKSTTEINVTADKPLYTYQIDTVNDHIFHGNKASLKGISLADSLGNVTVLEAWLDLIATSALSV